MPRAKKGSIGTLVSSQSMSMLTSRAAPAVPPTAIVRRLLASWNRRRVLRSVKKVFQSSVGVEDSAAAAADVGAVVVEAWRRGVLNWHCTRAGLLAIGWVWNLIEGTDFEARAVHCRCDRAASEEYWQLAPLVTVAWSLRLRAPRALSRAADVAGVNISSGITARGVAVH